MNKLIAIGIVCLLNSVHLSAQKKDGDDFKAVLSKHLNAVSDRNLTDLAATVADSVTLIFPDGEVLKSKQRFVEFHKEWFKDVRWYMTTEVLSATESKTLSYSLIKYHFTKFNEDGTMKSQSDTYLLLIFRKQKNGWKLIHDQNTRIEI
jgi:ketosteroid isomerase-like protein